jgi:hypothetical protein
MAHDRTQLIRLGAIALASGATLSVLAGTAGAATPGSSGNNGAGAVPTTLDGIKAKAATDITDRVDDLNAAIAKVHAAKGLGASQTTLVSYLCTDIAPLQQLNQTIDGDSTLQQAAHDFGTIFSGYRVYRLVLPAARIAAAADEATTSAIPNLTTHAAKAQARVNPANRATLQPLVNDLDSQISSATNATNGLAATVLAFTPAQWNADTALLHAPRSSDQAATAALQKGRADLRQMVQDLEADHAAATAASTTTTTS